MKNATRTTVITAIDYKGFTVQEADDGRFYIVGLGPWRADGYGTLSTAKGAVTKHLNAIPADGVVPADLVFVPDGYKLSHQIDPTGDFTGIEKRIAETLAAPAGLSRLEYLLWSRSICASPSRVLTNPSNPQDLLGGDWWEDENPAEAAELAALQAATKPVVQSRNKREGRFLVKREKRNSIDWKKPCRKALKRNWMKIKAAYRAGLPIPL